MDQFMSLETLGTFAGLVTAVTIIVQFTKSIVKDKLGDIYVRLYTFIIGLVLTFVFAGYGKSLDGVLLTVINSIIVTMASIGTYETIADPKAEKSK